MVVDMAMEMGEGSAVSLAAAVQAAGWLGAAAMGQVLMEEGGMVAEYSAVAGKEPEVQAGELAAQTEVGEKVVASSVDPARGVAMMVGVD